MRGGGPRVERYEQTGVWSLPRARGWTVDQVQLLQALVVSSLCAGAVRADSCSWSMRRYLCLVSEGGPSSLMKMLSSYVRLPRARGWTQLRQGRRGGQHVSPPPAGMNRTFKSTIPCAERLFPVRGGGPGVSSGVMLWMMSLPRGRGWTVSVGRGAVSL